jgi:hypothetical protein
VLPTSSILKMERFSANFLSIWATAGFSRSFNRHSLHDPLWGAARKNLRTRETGRISASLSQYYRISVTQFKIFRTVKGKSYPCNRPRRLTGLWDVEALTVSLDNRLTDSCEVVSLTRRPPFTPRNIPGTHFCWRLSPSQGHSGAGRIKSIVNPMTSSGIEPVTLQLLV